MTISKVQAAQFEGRLPKVLVVDDRPETLFAVEKVLSKTDSEVFKARSGDQALSLLLRHEFCVVLLDVQMPDMDGFEVAALMRYNVETRHIPIIFVTAISKEDKHVFKEYETGAVDCLFKPIDAEILSAKVRVFVQLHEQKMALEKTTHELEQVNQQLTSEMDEHKNVEAELHLASRFGNPGNPALPRSYHICPERLAPVPGDISFRATPFASGGESGTPR